MSPGAVRAEVGQFVTRLSHFADLGQFRHIESHADTGAVIGPALAVLEVETLLDRDP